MHLPSLAQRAKLAVHCLTEYCDKTRGNIPYFYTRMTDHPVTASLAIWSYGDGLGRSVDALTLLRLMLGEPVNEGIDRVMTGTLISLLGEEGLSWCPPEPWTMPVAHTRPAWLQQGTLLGFTSLYQATGDSEFRRLAERNIGAVRDLTTFHPEGYGDYPGDYYTRGKGWSGCSNDPMHARSVFSTSITMPLMRYYRLTGFEPAFALANSLISWALRDHDGGDKLFDVGHFHCQSRLVTAILTRAVCTDNKADFQLGERLYLKARSLGTQGGWFPEQINNPDMDRSETSETCCLTDMLECAILLAEHYDPRYWNDAERYAKNYLLAHQIVDNDWFAELTSKVPDQMMSGFIEGRGDCVQEARLNDALLGGFAGWGGVTCMSHNTTYSNCNQHCCNAAGARAIYDAWYYAAVEEGDVLSINLLIHREHPAASIVVEEGPTGKLDITIRQPRRLRVRIPEFVKAEEMSVRCAGQPLVCRDEGGYLDAGWVRPGDVIQVIFPQKPRTTVEKIYPGVFTYAWQGSTILHAEPIRGVRPLFTPERFQRETPNHISMSKITVPPL
ncbi:MAG: glycoside hydrolase family 127 protein [Kiritimatiellae bacterium]|nr:glycoside hydrolase family 127 protein [Kiritimatiellia bacterium]